MATMLVDPAAPVVYPRLYPRLENPSVQFIPIHPQEETEEVLEKEGLRKTEEEERVEVIVNGEGEEEGRQGEEEEEGRPEESAECSPLAAETSPSSVSPNTRETTGDGENTEQTTPNGDGGTSASTEERENPAANEKSHTAEDGGHPTLREEFVDRAWEEFVTDFLLGSCHIQKAAIFDLATRRPLAMNGHLRISPEELEQLVASLHHLQLAYRNGVTLEGKTYKVRLADGRNGIWARTEREGCTVCKTNTLIIVGVHDQRGNPRKCNEDVMRLGDFFRKKAI